jgi:hypothetical protein
MSANRCELRTWTRGAHLEVRTAKYDKSRQIGGFRAVGANLECELRTRIHGLSVGVSRAIAPSIVFAKEGPVKFMYLSLKWSINARLINCSTDANYPLSTGVCQLYLCL